MLVGEFGAFIGGGGGHQWFVERIHEVLQSQGKELGFGLGPDLFESLIDLQKRFLYRDAVTKPLTHRLVGLLDLWPQTDGRSVA